MITIVATYYNRMPQLLKTLDSFRQYDPADFNVVIVDDNSPQELELGAYPFEITILRLNEKRWFAPAPVFNFGFRQAWKDGAKSVIIQNAECYHNGDIIGYVKKHLSQSNYLSFACYSLGKGEDVDLKHLNMRIALNNGDSAWYNHSIYRPEALHFCCAITMGNLKMLNGFDERFSDGLGYEDNYFIHQVRCLGLDVKIVDSPFVFHQYHYDNKAFDFNENRYNRNAALFKELRHKMEYRAEHIYTEDL